MLGIGNPISRTPGVITWRCIPQFSQSARSLTLQGYEHNITLLTTRSNTLCGLYLGRYIFDPYRWKWCNHMISFFWQSLGSSVDCDKCGKLSFNGLSPADRFRVNRIFFSLKRGFRHKLQARFESLCFYSSQSGCGQCVGRKIDQVKLDKVHYM